MNKSNYEEGRREGARWTAITLLIWTLAGTVTCVLSAWAAGWF